MTPPEFAFWRIGATMMLHTWYKRMKQRTVEQYRAPFKDFA
jgi:hypothetical protein